MTVHANMIKHLERPGRENSTKNLSARTGPRWTVRQKGSLLYTEPLFSLALLTALERKKKTSLYKTLASLRNACSLTSHLAHFELPFLISQ
jgi:hypothetical protein